MWGVTCTFQKGCPPPSHYCYYCYDYLPGGAGDLIQLSQADVADTYKCATASTPVMNALHTQTLVFKNALDAVAVASRYLCNGTKGH